MGGSEGQNATGILAGTKERYKVIFKIIQETIQCSNT
jgi:hypothetical protein